MKHWNYNYDFYLRRIIFAMNCKSWKDKVLFRDGSFAAGHSERFGVAAIANDGNFDRALRHSADLAFLKVELNSWQVQPPFCCHVKWFAKMLLVTVKREVKSLAQRAIGDCIPRASCAATSWECRRHDFHRQIIDAFELDNCRAWFGLQVNSVQFNHTVWFNVFGSGTVCRTRKLNFKNQSINKILLHTLLHHFRLELTKLCTVHTPYLYR